MGVLRSFISIAVKSDRVMSVSRVFSLISSKVKLGIEPRQRFHFNSSKFIQRSVARYLILAVV